MLDGTYNAEPHLMKLRSVESSLMEPWPEEPPPEETSAEEPPPVEPAPDEPSAEEPPAEEPTAMEASIWKPKLVRKLYFRKPYDYKRKPVRHVLRPSSEPTEFHKLIFRDPNELKEEILMDISTIHSLKRIDEADQRRLEDLLGVLMHLNNDEMRGMFE